MKLRKSIFLVTTLLIVFPSYLLAQDSLDYFYFNTAYNDLGTKLVSTNDLKNSPRVQDEVGVDYDPALSFTFGFKHQTSEHGLIDVSFVYSKTSHYDDEYSIISDDKLRGFGGRFAYNLFNKSTNAGLDGSQTTSMGFIGGGLLVSKYQLEVSGYDEDGDPSVTSKSESVFFATPFINAGVQVDITDTIGLHLNVEYKFVKKVSMDVPYAEDGRGFTLFISNEKYNFELGNFNTSAGIVFEI